MVSYDSDVLDLTWTSVTDPAVDSYQIDISGLTPTESFTSSGTGTNTRIAVTLTPMVVYPTIVRAADGISLGPSSPALVPLTAAPVKPVLGYTGTALQLAWQASGESGVTGYDAALMANGGEAENVAVATSPQVFTTPFATATAYIGRVRATGDATQGPWADATGPYRSVRTYQFDALGGSAASSGRMLLPRPTVLTRPAICNHSCIRRRPRRPILPATKGDPQ